MGMGSGIVHLAMTASPPKDAGGFTGKGVKEPPTPRPHPEERPEENHGVDALAPLPRPIHILQSEPERELVQRQRRADAIEQGRQARRPVERATDASADLRGAGLLSQGAWRPASFSISARAGRGRGPHSEPRPIRVVPESGRTAVDVCHMLFRADSPALDGHEERLGPPSSKYGSLYRHIATPRPRRNRPRRGPRRASSSRPPRRRR